MKYVVYHNISLRVALVCDTQGGASRSAGAKNRKAAAYARKMGNTVLPGDYYTFTDQEHYDKNVNVMTTTYSMMDPDRKPIAIRAADKGGCCDPATETYWST